MIKNRFLEIPLSYFKIHVAENGKRDNVERLFKGEAYLPYWLRYKNAFY
ncbi:MAG: hypothetical protein LBH59_08145 [Planctomycetaceae bacterium]|nr:hypothetical protein [Planctomycetaceae bacterium]